MKNRLSMRFWLGPALTLLTSFLLAVLAEYGVLIPHNELLLFTLVVFSGFHDGVWSGVASILVAAIVYTLILAFPGTIPDFTVHPWEEIIALGSALPLIVLMVGLLRRRLDERVRESEDGYRTVVENIDEVFFLISTDFKKLYYISSAYEKIWGRPASEFYERPSAWLEAVHPQDRDALTSYIDQLLAGTWPISRDASPYRVIRPDGTVRWLVLKAMALRDPDGTSDRFVGIARDITAQMTAETSERETYRRFKAVLENAPVAIFTTDKDGTLTLREGHGGERAGVKPGQGIGTSYFEQFKDVPRHVENVRRALKGETFSERLQVRKGFFEIAYAPILNAKGGFDGMVGIATDITERAEAEGEVKELNALKSKFITVVSHQLRTPLSAMRWNMEMLLNDELGKLKKAQRDIIRVNYVANGWVITRIHDFLLALDIEEGRTAISREPIALDSLWQSAMVDFIKKCELKEQQCSYVPPTKPLLPVSADANKIRAVMEKLADNAVAYTPKGPITVRLAEIEGAVRFEISDTGIGIPKTEQPRIFNRFYRASNAFHVQPDASGLGLYIAKHFVESHGGRIGFESEEGKGSTFWFEIPHGIETESSPSLKLSH